jgi:hypothetical protein
LLTGSASAVFWLSRLNSTPHTIAVYASHPPSPATTQHSLPGARYGLPGPVSHRLDHASFPGAQATQGQRKIVRAALDCFAEPVIRRRYAPTGWLAMTELMPIQLKVIMLYHPEGLPLRRRRRDCLTETGETHARPMAIGSRLP